MITGWKEVSVSALLLAAGLGAGIFSARALEAPPRKEAVPARGNADRDRLAVRDPDDGNKS